MSEATIVITGTDEHQGAAAFSEPRRLAELRSKAAIDMQGKLPRFMVVPGPIYQTEAGEMTVDADLSTGTRVPYKGWGIQPVGGSVEHGLWAEKGIARLSPQAESQLCALTNPSIPKNFLKALPADMQMQALNYAVQKFSQREDDLFRLSALDSRIEVPDWRLRAILSTKYAPMDDTWLWDVMSDALQHFPEARLHEVKMDDDFTRATLQFGTMDLGDSAGQVGIVLTNSETGSAAIRLDSWVNKLVCLNGMVMKVGDSGYSFRHISAGTNVDTISAAMYDAIGHAREAGLALRNGLNKPVMNAPDELRKIVVQNAFSKEMLESLVAAWETKPLQNVTGVVDAITLRAHQEGTPVIQQHQLEVLAGSYLTRALATA